MVMELSTKVKLYNSISVISRYVDKFRTSFERKGLLIDGKISYGLPLINTSLEIIS